MARRVALAAGAALAAQLGPAATWLPRVRRSMAPALLGLGAVDSVALTFDDGPHPEGTRRILGELDRLGWKATFFLIGGQARRHRDVVREVIDAGHEVALHGDEHRYLIARWPHDVYDDLRRCRDSVGDLVGTEPTWWRPPYGVLSGPALAAARVLHLRPVLWSAWGRDWRAEATAQSVVDDLESGQVAGGALLLHDSDITSTPESWRTTLASLPLLADRLAVRGLRVRALTEHVASGRFGA